MRKTIVVGGGAAGMMAAISAAECGDSVILIEKNKYLGAKVIISGGGRCNVTTGLTDVRKVIENYPRGKKFLMSAISKFPPEKVMEWFENEGIRLKVEKDLRVFPVSDNGKDIVGALERKLRELEVEILFGEGVKNISKNGLKFEVELSSGDKIEGDKVVLACGGNAYRHTGSSGDGYAWAMKLGHSITKLAPSLNSFITAEKWVKEVSGISFQDAKIYLVSFDGKRKFEKRGPILFAHFGVTGPAVFAVSAEAAHENYSMSEPMKLRLNLFPDENFDLIEKKIMDVISQNSKKNLVNILNLFLPKSLCETLCFVYGLNAEKKGAEISKDDRKKMVRMMCEIELNVVGRGAGDEFVTCGGVELDEVNGSTMESKICPGLYFAGEILDIDGVTGGFNLQAAWSTGKQAGISF